MEVTFPFYKVIWIWGCKSVERELICMFYYLLLQDSPVAEYPPRRPAAPPNPFQEPYYPQKPVNFPPRYKQNDCLDTEGQPGECLPLSRCHSMFRYSPFGQSMQTQGVLLITCPMATDRGQSVGVCCPKYGRAGGPSQPYHGNVGPVAPPRREYTHIWPVSLMICFTVAQTSAFPFLFIFYLFLL